MVTLKYLSPSTRYCELFIDSESDLQDCPSITGAGKGNMSTISGISQGSKAILTTTADYYYRLKGDNTWTKVTAAGGGGGGDAEPLTPAEMEALANAINNGTGGN